jgi:hypothetical protein
VPFLFDEKSLVGKNALICRQEDAVLLYHRIYQRCLQEKEKQSVRIRVLSADRNIMMEDSTMSITYPCPRMRTRSVKNRHSSRWPPFMELTDPLMQNRGWADNQYRPKSGKSVYTVGKEIKEINHNIK